MGHRVATEYNHVIELLLFYHISLFTYYIEIYINRGKLLLFDQLSSILLGSILLQPILYILKFFRPT